LAAFVAEINTVGLLSFATKILQRFLLSVVAEWAEQSIDSPLIAAMGAKEITLSPFFLQ